MSKESKRFWEIKNQVENESADIFIYGDISSYDYWDDDVTPKKFNDELKELGDVKNLNLRINSNGGSVFAAYAIMNSIKRHKAHVTTYIDGIAASAASIIAMAGDKIIMPLGSMMMIHNPSYSFWGSYQSSDLRKMAEDLDTIKETMINVYTERTGLEETKITELLDDETYLTPMEAIDYGFADSISDAEVAAYLTEDKAAAFFNGVKFDINNFQNKEKVIENLPTKEFETLINETLDNMSDKKGRLSEEPLQNNIQANNNQKQEEIIMDLQELKDKYPDIYNQVKNEGISEGAKTERERIQEIENLSLPGMDDISSKAKFETCIDASSFAMEIVKAQKQKGANYLNNAINDAEPINHVEAKPLDMVSNTDEEQALLAHAKSKAEKLRR